MIEVNKVILVGRLTKDVELRKTTTNTSVCDFTVAINRRYSNKDGEKQADFIDCTAWRQSAELLSNYARKGDIVYVEGRLEKSSYDGQNGKVYKTTVIADNLQIINKANASAGGVSTNYTTQNETFTPSVDNDYNESLDDDFDNIPSLDVSNDDLPYYSINNNNKDFII